MLGKEEICAHCGTTIQDRSTMQKSGGDVYCCPNCANTAAGAGGNAAVSCAHCGTPITFIATQQEIDGKTYCCLNCATVAGATERA